MSTVAPQIWSQLRGAVRIAVIVLAACVAVRADVLSLESAARKRLSLNGTWKMHAGDDARWSEADYDHDDWAGVTVPGALPKAPESGGSRVVWLRRTFTAPAGVEYSHLRLDRVLDEAQVWINGRRLTNPAYPKPFEDTQFGAFARIWTMNWPDAFEADGVIMPGRENVIAVRIRDHAERGTKTFDEHPGETADGAAGLTGDAYLITRPATHIKSIERVHPLTLKNGALDTHLYVLLGNDTLETQSLRLSLTVYEDANGGHAVFDEQREVRLPPGGELYDFRWKAAPSFMPYRAVATLRKGPALADTAGLRFHTVFVSADRNGLRVNAEPFAMRGVHGNPGLAVSGAGRGVLTWSQLEEDLDALRQSGVNTVHTSNPTPRLAQEALARGMMIVPSLTAEFFDETVIALKEQPNILFWEVSTDKPNSLYVMASLIAAVDPYRRPIAYRGPLEIAPGSRLARNIAITARAARGPDAARDCGDSGKDSGGKLPVYLYPWDPAGKGAPAHAGPAHAGEFLARAWDACVAPDRAPAGGVYTALTTQSAALPGLRPPGSMRHDPEMTDAMLGAYREIEPDVYTNAAGSRVLTLNNISGHALRGLEVYTAPGSRPAGKQALLAAGRRFNMPLPGAIPAAVRVRFVTHGGLRREFTFNASAPLAIPGRLRFDGGPLEIKPGAKGRATALIVNKSGETVKCRLKLESSLKGVAADSPSRSIIVQPGDTARVTVTLTAGAGAKPGAGALTAVLTYEDDRWRPLTAVLPISIE